MQLLTDMQVGKAIPLVNFLSFLNAFPVSSTSLLSPNIQRSLTLAEGLHPSTNSFSTPGIKCTKIPTKGPGVARYVCVHAITNNFFFVLCIKSDSAVQLLQANITCKMTGMLDLYMKVSLGSIRKALITIRTSEVCT